MIKILKHLRGRDWIMLCVCAVFIFAQVFLELKIPELLSKITLLIGKSGQEADIWQNGIYMLLCAVGTLASAAVVCFIVAWIAASFSRRLRSKVYDKVSEFSMGEIKMFSTSSLITRSTNDITQIQMLITMGVQSIIKAPIMAVWAIVKISQTGNFQWSIITAAAIGVQVLMFTFLIIFVMPKFKKMQKLTDNINKIARENLTGLRVVRAYNAENYQDEKFGKANKEITDTALFTNRALAIMMPFMNTILSGLTLAVYWIGAYIIRDAALADQMLIYSNMLAFSGYAVEIIFAFMLLVMIIMILPRASVSAKRINEVLDCKVSIKDGFETESDPSREGEIVFNNVSFKYPDAAEYILDGINFTAKKGETVAFIGSTGSGKSTLINLVPRFFDATEGEILVDGVNVKDYKLEALYNKIGYVPQKAVIFKGSVTFNVAYGKNGDNVITEDDVRKAIRIAQGQEFVEKMNDGYNADISQSGSNISGGQKQRLSIARAIARKPEIYIFDDSFSALDYKTDRVLRTALKKETAGVTSLIVAQRVGTIMDADQIIVLHDGKIVGKGKHKELLGSCEVYKQIAQSQLSEEELSA